MKAIALVLCAVWIAAGAGSLLVGRLRVLRDTALERFVYSAALGLGIAAYGVLLLGLVGQLRFWPVTLWWLVLAGAGLPGMLANGRDLLTGLKQLKLQVGQSSKLSGGQVVCVASGAVVLLCAGIAVLACFLPPNGLDWDAVAYHLADPKVFLAQGRITSLPTEHHSNFPFMMEMLYTVGLLYDGYVLANLFHGAMGALTVAAMLAFCRRHLNAVTGWIAALLFVTTPVVLWEAGVAYIELGLGLYTTLAAFAAISAVKANREQDAPDGMQWAVLAGVMMGFGLGMKYLALLPFVFVGLYLLYRRCPLRSVAIYAAVALTIASPWYVKNIVLTRNPVYPFAYGAFPQSKYWSADRAAMYQAEQDSFGAAHSLKRPAEAGGNLLLVPWELLANSNRYSNAGEYTFMALFGGIYAAFGFALVLQRRIPQTVRDLLLLGVLQAAAWFFVAQVSRYLAAVVPLFAVVCGWSAWKLASSQSGENNASKSLSAGKIAVGLALAGQVVMLLWGVFVLPTNGRVAFETGAMVTAFSVPDALATITTPDGAEQRLRRTFDVYAAEDWLNQNTAKDAGVILFETVHGFYLDRSYLWGNAQHSSYIPYDTFQNGADMTAWFAAHGFRYALINLNQIRPKFDPDGSQFPQGVNGQEEAALRRWYAPGNPKLERWQGLIYDALQSGPWRMVFAKNGVAVLEMQAGEKNSGRGKNREAHA